MESDKKERARAVSLAQVQANNTQQRLHVWVNKETLEYVVVTVESSRVMPGYVFVETVAPRVGLRAWWQAIRAKFRNRSAPMMELPADGETEAETRANYY